MPTAVSTAGETMTALPDDIDAWAKFSPFFETQMKPAGWQFKEVRRHISL